MTHADPTRHRIFVLPICATRRSDHVQACTMSEGITNSTMTTYDTLPPAASSGCCGSAVFRHSDTVLRARPLESQQCTGRYSATESARMRDDSPSHREGRQPERSARQSRGPELTPRRASEKIDVWIAYRVKSVRRVGSARTRGVGCRTVPSGSPWHSMRARGGRAASSTRYPGSHGS